ncbi:hypothetical protein I4U23_026149 [Adineta vaga]|nr:hypothetical protein I4U23_026149 [Adineta vaga]
MSSDQSVLNDLNNFIYTDILSTESLVEFNSLPSSGHSSSLETYNNNSFLDFILPPLNSLTEDLPEIDEIPLHPSLSYSHLSNGGTYQYLTDGSQVSPPIKQNSINDDDEQSAMIGSNTDSLPISRPFSEKLSNSSIPLSSHVHITDSSSKKLQLVNLIEETYRARYKSDYFPQNGTVRYPRYIADRKHNHYITLQLPSVYHYDLANKYIRIALITISIDGHNHYYSPYKFQKDHTDPKIPDENPIYIKIDTNKEQTFLIRLQLVLIKSKLDQLNNVQPLKRFSDSSIPIRNIVPEIIVSPKELIHKYQLDKSHLAFTICTKQSNGTYKPDPDTTVISTVISEVSLTKKTNETPVTTVSKLGK